ncbi:efflux RND transporter periplasmic adaptor subunit [Shimia sp. MIT1388]|uniref:efflux RND transporter periplasmic adaptor subunit n=1 Tax=Shimia sp. MIT1388 TaxID=3096992 RepID=UPI00399A336B
MIAFLAACKPQATAAPSSDTVLRSVKTTAVVMRSRSETRHYPTVLEPKSLVALSFEIGGRVTDIDLRIGQHVEKGETLATIEPVNLDIQLGQARAALIEARAYAVNAQEEAARQIDLFERKVVSKAYRDRAITTFKQANARLEQMQSNVDLLQETRDDAELRAPFNGVIASVDVQDFAGVRPAQPVLTLYEEGHLQAQVLVSAQVAQSLEIGRAVSVVATGGRAEALPARVTEIGRRAAHVAAFPVVITLSDTNFELRAGTPVEVAIDVLTGHDEKLLALPRDSLFAPGVRRQDATSFEAQVFVFVPKGDMSGTLDARSVSVVAAAGDQVFVTGRLAEGEHVVTAGVAFLRDTQAVRRFQGRDL